MVKTILTVVFSLVSSVSLWQASFVLPQIDADTRSWIKQNNVNHKQLLLALKKQRQERGEVKGVSDKKEEVVKVEQDIKPPSITDLKQVSVEPVYIVQKADTSNFEQQVKELENKLTDPVFIASLKGEKGDPGEPGETVTQTITKVVTTHGTVGAPGVEAKDGAGSTFAAKYIGADHLGVTSELNVDGDSTFDNITVSGTSNLSGALAVAATTVTGNFTVQDSNSNLHLYVDNNTGNVGIGTTGMGTLFVVGSSTPSSIASSDLYNSAYISGDLEVEGTIHGSLSASTLSLNEGNIYVGNSSNNAIGTTTIFISDDGNVGIGTTDPQDLLQVYSTGDTQLSITAGNTNDAVLNFGDQSNDSSGRIRYDNNIDAMWFVTNATEKMRITSGGNVGIGTTGPGAKFEIAKSDGDTGPLLRIASSTTEALYVSESGNVGIGTTTPAAGLQIGSGTPYGSVGADGIYVVGYSQFDDTVRFYGNLVAHAGLTVQSSNHYNYLFVSPGSDDGVRFGLDGNSGVANNNLIFTTGGNYTKDHDHELVSANPTIFIHSSTNPNTNNTEWGSFSFEGTGSGDGYFNFETGSGDIVFQPNGNVGIGTTDPWADLDVKSTAPTLRLTSSSDSLHSEIDGTAGNIYLQPYNGFRDIIFKALGQDEVMRVTGDGNVGIGTTAPERLLEIGSYPSLKIYDYNLNAESTFTISNDIGPLSFNAKGSHENYGMNFSTANQQRMRIDSSGNVGIGTTGPSQQLEITGDFEMPNTTHVNESGIIYKNEVSFLHNFNYGDNGTVTTTGRNTFLGQNAGNLTMGSTATLASHGSYNSGVGTEVLYANAKGYYNSALGYWALRYNSDGAQNVAVGSLSLYANSTGSSNTAVGYRALVSNTTSSGNTAMGNYSLQASNGGSSNSGFGNGSLYMNSTGNSNSALGAGAGKYIANGSTGNITGDYNVFIGANTKALADDDQNEIVIGYDATGAGSNSVVLGNDSILTTVLKGNVGIGTTDPGAKLEVKNGSVLFDGTIGSIPATGVGTRLMWYPAKSAFRAGTIAGNEWDDVSIGSNSMAMGNMVRASGNNSVAMGISTTASGNSAVALGSGTTASGDYSTAMGYGGATASSYGATAMGRGTTASGYYSTAIGYTTTAQSYASFVIGKYNVGGGTASSWVSTDPLFEIGIGDDVNNKANALTVLKNGNVGIGTTTPAGLLDVDGRLVVLESGNVGIGTTGPGAKLEVIGDIRVGGKVYPDYATDSGTYIDGGVANKLQLRADSYVTGVVGGSERMALSTSKLYTVSGIDLESGGELFVNGTGNSWILGNVGIGTTNPGVKLDVEGIIRADDGTAEIALGSVSGVRRLQGFMSGPTMRFLSTSNGYAGVGLGSLSVGGNYGGTSAPSNGAIIEGNVGIGTTDPGQKLEVNGNVLLSGQNWFSHNALGYFGNGTVISGGLSTETAVRAANDLLFSAGGNTERMRINSNGYVGIGTTNPIEEFVVSDGGAEGFEVDVNGLANGVYYTTYDRAGAAYEKAFHRAGSYVFGIGSTERMVIDTNGNVGIGTTDPGEKLEVIGNVELGANLIQTTSADANVVHDIYSNSVKKAISGYGLAGDYYGIGHSESGIGNIGSAQLVVKEGNVGIGTTGPGAKLDVYGTGNTNMYVESSAASGIVFQRLVNGTGYWQIENDGTNSNDLNIQYGSGDKVTIDTTGNVGIGTTNPEQKLHVDGKCVTGDTLLPVRYVEQDLNTVQEGVFSEGETKGSKEVEYTYSLTRIDEIMPGYEVLSLNETNGITEYQKVNALMDMGIKQTVRLKTSSGRYIKTTFNHPYLVKKEVFDGGKHITFSKGTQDFLRTRDINVYRNREIGSGVKEEVCPQCTNLSQSLNNTHGEEGIDKKEQNENNREIQSSWKKVSELEVGMQIAVPAIEKTLVHEGGGVLGIGNLKEDVLWEKIVSIETLDKQQVWDIEVAGTHNFVAGHLLDLETNKELTEDREKELLESGNLDSVWFAGIYAHNTYLSNQVGIATTTPWADMELAIDGDIMVTGDIYKSGSAYTNPDYVYATYYGVEDNYNDEIPEDYDMLSLEDLKVYIQDNLHLPGIEFNGGPLSLFERNRLNLEKIEELSLYLFELDGRMDDLLYTMNFGMAQDELDVEELDTEDTTIPVVELTTKIDRLEVKGDSTFKGNITFEKTPTFNSDTIGRAKILAGDTFVRVEFEEEYEYEPIVTISSRNFVDGQYRVATTTTQWFMIELSKDQYKDTEFNWHAFATSAPKLHISDGTVEDISIVVVDNIPSTTSNIPSSTEQATQQEEPEQQEESEEQEELDEEIEDEQEVEETTEEQNEEQETEEGQESEQDSLAQVEDEANEEEQQEDSTEEQQQEQQTQESEAETGAEQESEDEQTQEQEVESEIETVDEQPAEPVESPQEEAVEETTEE